MAMSRKRQTTRQRYLIRAYAGAWIALLVSFGTTTGVGLNAASAPDPSTGQILGYVQKYSVGYVTAAQDRLDLWARVVLTFAILICAFGPTVAARAAWLEPVPRKAKPPRLWD
jgi:hypothetical protein